MQLYIRPVYNKTGKLLNSENQLCHQLVYTAVFSSKRGITVAPIWLDIDLLSGIAVGEIWLRTDLICRGSHAYQNAHRGGNLLSSRIIRIPAALFMPNMNAIINQFIATCPFKLSRKELKKAHKTLRKMAERHTLQPA